jgi:hypothetical protein
MSEKCFLFRSGDNVHAETGHTVVDAWGNVIDRARTAPVPAWLRTDKIEAWSVEGQFIDVMTWDERTAQLEAVDLWDSMADCNTCDGSGVVVFDNEVTVDRNVFVERLRETCPVCDGACRVVPEPVMFSGPG